MKNIKSAEDFFKVFSHLIGMLEKSNYKAIAESLKEARDSNFMPGEIYGEIHLCLKRIKAELPDEELINLDTDYLLEALISWGY